MKLSKFCLSVIMTATIMGSLAGCGTSPDSSMTSDDIIVSAVSVEPALESSPAMDGIPLYDVSVDSTLESSLTMDVGSQMKVIGYLAKAKAFLDAYYSGRIISALYDTPEGCLKEAGDHLGYAGYYMDKLTVMQYKEIEPVYLELKAVFLKILNFSPKG